MKTLSLIKTGVLLLLVLFVSCSKEKQDETTANSDADKFVGKYYGMDYLDITKVDNSKIMLYFYQDPDESSNWDHTFTADVSGNKFVVSGQYWSAVQSNVTAYGTLEGDVVTIDYHYDNGESETGLEYTKIGK